MKDNLNNSLKTPESVAAAAKNPNPEIRQEAALSSMATMDTLTLLASDPDASVRLVVATCENLSPDLYRKLWADGEYVIRCEVLANRACPEDILLSAVRRTDPTTISHEMQVQAAYSLAATDKVLWEAFKSNNPEVRCAAADNMNATEDMLDKWARDPNPDTREVAAANENIGVKALVLLLQDGNEAVRASAVLNEKTTDEMVGALLNDPSVKVQAAIKRRENVNEFFKNENVANLKDPVDDVPLYSATGGTKLTFAQREMLSEGKTIRLQGQLCSWNARKQEFSFRPVPGQRIAEQPKKKRSFLRGL